MKIKRILSTLLCLCAIVLLFPTVNLTAQGASTTILNESKGILSMNYSGSYSDWKDITGEYKAISVTAKNYLPMAQSTDGNGKIGYSMVLRVTMDNGKFYAFRIINEVEVRYGYSRFGADGAANGWDGKCWVDTKDTSVTNLINGAGAEFKVERTAANILTVTLNGKVLDTYTMEGVTASNKVVSVGVKHYGNPASTKYAVEVPYTVTYARESVKVQTANTSNGKVTTDKNLYRVGDTVKLTVTPNSGYAYSSLKVNGKTVTPNTSGVYSFVAQESTYEVSATFTKAVFTENTGDHWNLIHQGAGKLVLNKHSSGNSGWLKAVNNVSDITTTVRDYYPAAKDFSMIYQFTFNNGEKICLRLNGTDSDGKYKIQVMDGSTLSAKWISHYTLTDAQITKVKDSGIKFRTAIEGSNAVVYLDGTKVCSIDLSKIVETGKASYIKNMPVRVELRMDGNLNKSLTIPFQMTNSIVPITVTVPTFSNGKVTADKTTCVGGDTVKLTVTPNSGYAYSSLKVNGKTVTPNTSGVYSFVAQESTYEVSATFTKAVFTENTGDSWNLIHQGAGKLVLNKHSSGNSGWLKAVNNVSDITTTVRDYYPASKDFSMIYQFTFNNGEVICLRLNGTDSDGKYKIQVMDGSTLSEQWKNHYTLTDAQITKVKDSGIKFRTAIEGSNAVVYLDGTKVCTIDLSKVVATGKASYVKNMPVRVELRMDGNLNKTVTIPFQMTNSIVPITVTVPTFSNGKVTADKTTCAGGDTVKLTVTPNSGYAYSSLKVNGKTVTPNTSGVYSFVAQESTYEVSATFTKAVFTENTGDHWNLIHQGAGKLVLNKHSSGNSGWLKAVNNVSDITTTVRDYYPAAKDFSMIYQFTFNNGEKICLRLNGTDSDGKYKIQVMDGSTLSAKWISHYTLTDAQITKVKDSGIKFRTAIEGSNAVVYLDGTKVCSIDLSKIVETGKASYIKNMPVRVELRMDGNLNKSLTIPYQMTNSIIPITVTIPTFSNGKVTADKTTCAGGDTVKLTVTPNSGYCYKTLKVNGKTVTPNTSGVYSFVAQESTYEVSATFTKAVFTENTSDHWNLIHQGAGKLVLNKHSSGNSGWLKAVNNVSDITTTVRDYYPAAKDFSMIYQFTFNNGEKICLRLNGTDSDGKYKIQVMDGSTLSEQWKNHYTLTDAQITKVKDSGIKFRTAIEGSNAVVYLDGTKVCSIDLSKIVETGKASYVKNMPVRVELRMDGNLNKSLTIPFQMTNSIVPITVTVPTFSNGKVTADKTTCEGGEAITLTVTPNNGYCQKLFLNGEPILLDQNSKYTFIANESTYNISGEFVKSRSWTSNTNVNKLNDAHNILMLNYTGNDSGWMDLKGNNNAFSVTIKNALPMAQSTDGNGNFGYSMVLRVTLDNGKFYAFRIINEAQARYAYSRYGAEGATTAWDGRCWIDTKDASVTDLINTTGATFKVERTSMNTLTITLNGKVLDTYTMEGVKASNKIVSVGFKQYGNPASSDYVVEVPFAYSATQNWSTYQFKTSEIGKYVIVYSTENPDYVTLANKLANRIYDMYGKKLSVIPDTSSTISTYEILLGDTNRYSLPSRVMEYSVTVDNGNFKINIGGSYSGEKAITYLCDNVFNGKSLTLSNGEYYKKSFLTSSHAVTSGTTARIMTANMLADAFSSSSYKQAYYRAEIFAGMLVSYTPDVIGLQETDANWNKVLDSYLTKIQKTYGIKYSRYLTTYEGKLNYTSLLYRSDKFKVENSGVKVFSWWADKTFNHGYHMRNISWAQFTSLSNSSKKFIVANTHWSYRTEHDNGKTYLSGSSKPIATNELRTQCKNETNTFLTSLKKTYSGIPIFLTGDFNTSLPFFTQYGWTPTSFNVISEQAKSNGTALSTVPTSGHFDHIFGTGSYTIKCYAFFKDTNQHKLLSDHPYAYVDLAF